MRRARGLILLALAACGGEHAATSCLDRLDSAPDGSFAEHAVLGDGSIRVTYDDGLVLDVPARPKRIVSTAPGLTETVAYLDGLDRLVGVTPWCNHPAGVEAIRRVTVMPLDLEGLVGLRPDLVVADRTLHRGSIEALRRRLPGALLLLETSRSLAHYERSLGILSVVVGGSRARERAGQWLERHAALERRLGQARASSSDPAPRVLVVSQWEPLYVEGPGGIMHDLLRRCGCTNAACDLGQASGTFSEELVLERRPDVILHREGPPPARLRARWSGLPALESGRMGSCASDAFSRGGPRILGALEALWAARSGDAPWTSLAEVR